MDKTLIPSLKDLRSSTLMAWLWDAERARIVWANGPGIAFFEGETLFDLIDRPFDANEAGIEAIRAAALAVETGGQTEGDVAFPSAGHNEPLACTFTGYRLSDGRAGVLVVELEKISVPQAETPSAMGAAFQLLPLAMVFIDKAGTLTSRNQAAEELLPVSGMTQLQEVLSGGRLASVLERLQAATVVAITGKLTGRYGERDVKVTARRLPEGEADYAFATLEDITERRLLEAQVPAEAAREVPQVEPAKAFEQLAKSIKKEMAAKPTAPKAVVRAETAESEAVKEAGRQQTIPDTIKQAMERSGEAVVIAQKGRAVFATERAAELLGYDSGEALINSDAIPMQLNALTESKIDVALPRRDGGTADVTVISTHIPWLHGAARQFRIRQATASLRHGAAVAPAIEADSMATETTSLALKERPLVAAQREAEAKTQEIAPPFRPKGNGDSVHEELRAVLDVVSDGIITLDLAGRILSFSAGAESIFGRPLRDVIGLPFGQLLEEGSRQVINDYMAALSGPGLASVFNDGREVMAKVNPSGTTPLFLTLGKLQSRNSDTAYCAVVRDITQWKRTEQDLRGAKAQAEETSKQKTDFLARIGHELRTPITAILGFADVMRQSASTNWKHDKFVGYANDIHSSGKHLLSLVNDLLDLSKAEAGKMDLEFTGVRLADPVEDAVRMITQQAAEAGVVVRTSLPARLPKVVADLRALRQILLNLLSNSVKFSDAGGEVIVSAALDAGGNMHLKVKDTGIGMSADQVEATLEPYKRVHTAGRETVGTGLGLPLTRALVEANRARFDISSEKGKGTTVDIVFPTNRVLSD